MMLLNYLNYMKNELAKSTKIVGKFLLLLILHMLILNIITLLKLLILMLKK